MESKATKLYRSIDIWAKNPANALPIRFEIREMLREFTIQKIKLDSLESRDKYHINTVAKILGLIDRCSCYFKKIDPQNEEELKLMDKCNKWFKNPIHREKIRKLYESTDQ